MIRWSSSLTIHASLSSQEMVAGATGVVTTGAVDVGMQPVAATTTTVVAMHNAQCTMQERRGIRRNVSISIAATLLRITA